MRYVRADTWLYLYKIETDEFRICNIRLCGKQLVTRKHAFEISFPIAGNLEASKTVFLFGKPKRGCDSFDGNGLSSASLVAADPVENFQHAVGHQQWLGRKWVPGKVGILDNWQGRFAPDYNISLVRS